MLSGEPIEVGQRPSLTDISADDRPQIARIVGGQDAGEKYGWVASLQNGFGHICGGTLVTPWIVATAAHCVEGEATTSLSVVLGRSNLQAADGQRIRVDRIISHPAYNSFTNDSDIALLRLTSAADESPIGYITQANVGFTAPGTQSLVLGWGATREDGPSSSELQAVRIPIVSNETANAPISYDGDITDNMLAAGRASGGIDSCQGDSGGPLVVFDADEQPLLAGIVSWGAGCARPNKYGIYTRVSQFDTWIRENANIESPRGVISFSPTRFLAGSTATISVEDTDLDGQSFVDVTVTSSEDTETVRLSSTGRGLFSGTVDIVEGTVNDNNGTLEVTGSEQILAVYEDENDGTGDARQATAAAQVVVDDFRNDATTQTALAIGQPLIGEIDVIADSDWFRFDLNANQGYEIQVELENGTLDDSVLSLYADDGETLLAIDDDGGRGLGSRVPYFSPVPTTVYVEVTGHGSNIGSYVILIEEVDFERDDHFDVFSLATPIQLGDSTSGDIEFANDRDWFQFTAEAGVLYQASVELEGLEDSLLRLVDRDGRTELAFNDDRSADELASRIHFFVDRPGTYYLEVRGYLDETGGYTLEFGESEDDHGNLPDNATPLGVVTDVVDFVSGEVTDFDEDWFSFEATAAQYYEFETVFVGSPEQLQDTQLHIFDTSGTQVLAANDDHLERLLSRIIWQAPADGLFFVQVQGVHGDTGLFDLEYWAPTTPPTDDGANFPAAADPAPINGSFLGNINYFADSDWFRLDTSAGATYEVDIVLGDLEDSVLRIWAEDGQTLLAENDDATSEDLSSYLEWTATESGPHFVQVLGFDGNRGSYRLQIDERGGTVGDVTGDGLIDARDIDRLQEAVIQQTIEDRFDLNGDGRLTEADVDTLVEDILNTQRGDTNLDGEVNFADFLALSASFGATGGWSQGDATGDQMVDFEDFLLLSANFGTSGPAQRESLHDTLRIL